MPHYSGSNAAFRCGALLLVLGCDGVSGPDNVADFGPATQMIVLDGGDQSAVVGTELPEAVAVRVLDARNRPVRDQIVNFRVTSGGGSVFAGTAITNRNGEARERWTLGLLTTDVHQLEARAVDNTTGDALTFAVFTATALPGPAAQLLFTGQPSSVLPGATIAPPVQVSLFDAFGNAATTSDSAVSVGLIDGTAGAVLSGTTTRTASGGVATFDDLAVDLGGERYRLAASSLGLAGAVSDSFNVIAPVSVARVDIRPISFGMAVGDTVTLTATAYDALDNPIGGLPVTWTQVLPAASLSAAGLLTALSEGGGQLDATIGGVTGPEGGGGFTVYASADSVSFTFTSGGILAGWTDTTLELGATICVRLHSFGPPGFTNPLRWEPGSSAAAIVQATKGSALPQSHCFTALQSGTVTVTGSFGGKVAQKLLTVP